MVRNWPIWLSFIKRIISNEWQDLDNYQKRVWITWIKIEGHWRKKVNKFNLRMLHGLSNLNIHWKDRCWSWNSNTLVTWYEELTPWKRPWCRERLKAGGGDDRGWDEWMASLIRWMWVWASSGRLWRTGKPGVLQSMGSQRVGHDWATENNNKEDEKTSHRLSENICKSWVSSHSLLQGIFPTQGSNLGLLHCR